MLTRRLALFSMAAFGWIAPHATAAPILVELFTSEGCHSCPPADVYLSELAKRPDATTGELVLISWHVDYWDHLGWEEPYGLAFASDRQRRYAAAMKRRGTRGAGVYTPQMVIDGQVAIVGHDRRNGAGAIEWAGKGNTKSLNVKAVSIDGELNITARLPEVSRPVRVIAVVVEDGLESKITAGENRGKTLKHDRVVRAVGEAQVVNGIGLAKLRVPEDVSAENASVVMFVQAGYGDVLALGSVALETTSSDG
ncbi:MAG: DUF1223 domain-containing protein [Planctomycetota bacterium]